MLERREKGGQQLNDFIKNNNLLKDNKDESSIVDLSNLPEELTGNKQTDLTLYGFSQYYKSDVDIDILLLNGRKKLKTAETTEVTTVQHEKRLPLKSLRWKNSCQPQQLTTTAPLCSI